MPSSPLLLAATRTPPRLIVLPGPVASRFAPLPLLLLLRSRSVALMRMSPPVCDAARRPSPKPEPLAATRFRPRSTCELSFAATTMLLACDPEKLPSVTSSRTADGSPPAASESIRRPLAPAVFAVICEASRLMTEPSVEERITPLLPAPSTETLLRKPVTLESLAVTSMPSSPAPMPLKPATCRLPVELPVARIERASRPAPLALMSVS